MEPAGPLQNLLRHLRRAASAGPSGGATDAQLLERFAARRDQDAFELLVWRHGPAVWGVCRRMLRHEQDAEDAFQAAFLALARGARRIGRGESVGGWLYRVAYRVALRLRARSARRACREQPLDDPVPDAVAADPLAEAAGRELREALEEQVSRLPARFRQVFVLRCLAGKSREETAQELGCPVGTVESRLARARERLRPALARRGFAAPAALAALAGAGGAARSAVPAPMVASTVQAATRFAAGKAAVAGTTSARAAALAEGVLRTMSVTKLKNLAALVLLLGVAAGGAAGLTYQAGDEERPRAGASATPQRPQGAKQVRDRNGAPEKVADVTAERDSLREKLKEVRQQAAIDRQQIRALKAAMDQQDRELKRRREEIDGVLQKVNIEKNTVSLTLEGTKLELADIPIATNAKFVRRVIKKGAGPDKECTINDLRPGMHASLRVETAGDRSEVALIRAYVVPKKN